jgi:hypothetical protein
MRNVFFAPGALPANIFDPELIRTKTLAHADAVKAAYGSDAIIALDTSILVCGASIIGEIREHYGLRVLADLKLSDSFHVLRHYLLSLSGENAPEFLTVSPMAGADTAKRVGDMLSSTKLYASDIAKGFGNICAWPDNVAKFAQSTPGVFDGVVCFAADVLRYEEILPESFEIVASGAYHNNDELGKPRLGSITHFSKERRCGIYTALPDAENLLEETLALIRVISNTLLPTQSVV